MDKQLEERIMSKVVKQGDCWLWRTTHSYPVLSVNGRKRRVAQIVLGIEKLEYNHFIIATCWNASCVNPKHLKKVDRGEKTRRKPKDWKSTAASGEYGIYANYGSRPWRVTIRKDNVVHHGGYYDSLEAAVTGRDELCARLGI